MNFNMKNRIWKKVSALGMTFLMAGMVLGGGGQVTTVCAAEAAQVYEVSPDDELQENIPEKIAENTGIDDSEENSETEESGSKEDKSEESGPDEMHSEENTEENEDEETENAEDTEDIDREDSDLSDGKSEEDENKKKIPDFSVKAVTDENTVKAGSDLVYTVTLENTGDETLKNVQLQAVFSGTGLSGEWSGEQQDAIDISENTAYIEQLDSGIKKVLYLTAKLPEEQETAVSVKITASAETGMTEEDVENAENTVIRRETFLETEVIPLKASFEVTKTADRSVAVPGDKILFQICIRNTGERTLHSVVTTERFQLGNVPVQFLEKEGVVLNRSKTKARIEKIEPGKAAGLEAMVTLPENIKEQELLNEVTVTTLETGEQVMTSQAKIQVKAMEKSEDSVEGGENDSADTDSSAVPHTGESYPASTHPKTGDPYQPLLWLAMIPGSILAAGWIRRRM